MLIARLYLMSGGIKLKRSNQNEEYYAIVIKFNLLLIKITSRYYSVVQQGRNTNEIAIKMI